MTEQQLRGLVREAIARHLGQAAPDAGPGAAPGRATLPSHQMFRLPDGDGACVVEPALACNHCGFCKSLGH